MLSQWIYDQIDEQLAPYRERGISREWLDSVAEAYRPRYAANFARFTIRSGNLTVRAQTERFRDYIASYFAVMNRAIAAIAPDLPDLQFEFYLNDGFTGWSSPTVAPVFGFSKHATKDISVILLPDPTTLSRSGGLRRQVREGSRDYPWETKIEKCFWRGGTNGGFSLDTYQSAVRYRLVQAALRPRTRLTPHSAMTGSPTRQYARSYAARGL
jgi:hypothetical protein